MIFPLDICCIFGVSYLRLGCLRTCQGIHRSQTWAAGVYRAKALPLMAVQWSDQMRGSCHSLRCRFSIAMFVWISTEMIQPELPEVLHNLNFEINPGEKVDWVHMMRSWTNLQSLDRHSRKDRVRKEHFGTVILQICRTHWRPNSCRWSGYFKNWVDRSSQSLDHYSAYVDLFKPDFLCQGLPDYLEVPTILSGSLRSTLDVFEEYQDSEIVSYMPSGLWWYSLFILVWSPSSCPPHLIRRHPCWSVWHGQCQCFPGLGFVCIRRRR